MKYILRSNIAKLKSAVDLALEVFQNDQFYQEIAAKDKFDQSDASPNQIAELLGAFEIPVNIEGFYPRWFERLKYRKTLAYTVGGNVYFNLRKMNRSDASLAATLVHETVHVVDNYSSEFSFGHGGNSSNGKGNTAPYWIGNLAYQILSGDTNADLQAVLDDESEIEDIQFV